MAFYDSVKEDIRDENGAAQPDDAEGDDVAFDQLKENADEQDEPGEEAAGSDDDIEVLGDGEATGEGGESVGQQAQEQRESGSDAGGAGAAAQQPGPAQGPAGTEQRQERAEPERGTQADDTAEVLRRIEQQNEEMLSVLRGIKRSLE